MIQNFGTNFTTLKNEIKIVLEYLRPCFWAPQRLHADMVYVKDGPVSYIQHQSGMERFQLKHYIPGLCTHIIYQSVDINGAFETAYGLFKNF